MNNFYRGRPELWELDTSPDGFEWIDCSDRDAGVVSFIRRDKRGGALVFAANFTPVVRGGYRIGFPKGGRWREALNSDSSLYGGSGAGNLGFVDTEESSFHGQPFSAELTLPPLGCLIFAPENGADEGTED